MRWVSGSGLLFGMLVRELGMGITSDAELEQKLELLGRLYRATRHEFSKLTITEHNALELLRATNQLTASITVVLSEIEEYTGAADIRLMSKDIMDRHRAKKNGDV